jgi:hypothetical protein
VLAVDYEEVIPWFTNDPSKEWIKQDLDDLPPDWWHDTVTAFDIDTIYYLETNENINMFIPTYEYIERIGKSDLEFINYLRTLFYAPEEDKMNVLYLSTDKVYYGDEFPNELNNMAIIQPEGNPEEADPMQNYATHKINSELSLVGIEMLNLRIIRPFSIVSHEQRPPWPLPKIIIDSITDAPLYVYKDGVRGIVYTHASDLATFINNPKLFDNEILNQLSSRIINFCRTQNYLPEDYLVKKIKDKTESSSEISYQVENDMFPYMMKTPQIRNMTKIGIPIIPIEKIIEEFIEKIDPVDIYAPIVVTGIEYLQDNLLAISGTAEPLGIVAVALGTGEHMISDVTSNGSWAVITDHGIYYEEETVATIHATTKDGLQYQTITVDIPPAPIPPFIP